MQCNFTLQLLSGTYSINCLVETKFAANSLINDKLFYQVRCCMVQYVK